MRSNTRAPGLPWQRRRCTSRWNSPRRPWCCTHRGRSAWVRLVRRGVPRLGRGLPARCSRWPGKAADRALCRIHGHGVQRHSARIRDRRSCDQPRTRPGRRRSGGNASRCRRRSIRRPPFIAGAVAHHDPVYAICGDHDRLVPLSHRHGLRVAFPQARIDVWHGMGHDPLRERPARADEPLEPVVMIDVALGDDDRQD